MNRRNGTLAALSAMLLMALGACGGHGHATDPAVDQGLWVANSSGVDVLEFAARTFSFSNIRDSAPHLTNASGSFVSPQDVLFDKDENLWVVDGGDGKGDATEGVFEFTKAQLRALTGSPNPAPAFAITNVADVPGFVFPQFAVFDRNGNLYVADPAIDVVFVFTVEQLTSSSGAGLIPAAVFQIDTSTAVLGLAFASDGRLFIADNGAAQIFELKKPHIPKSGGTAGSPTVIAADVILSSNDNPTFASIDGPWAMVFDVNGDLWFTNEGLILKSGPSVVEFAATDLASNAAPAPKVQLTAATLSDGSASIDDPQGLSFDNLGDLVIANAANSSVAKFVPGRIMKSGTPTPNLFIAGATSTLDAPAGVIFGPNH
jgi:hypothetical protein